MQIELEFHLDEPVDRPLIQYSLCNVKGEVVFGDQLGALAHYASKAPPGRHISYHLDTIYSASNFFAIRWPGVP